jgi:rhodanese-related sulfurtransferase
MVTAPPLRALTIADALLLVESGAVFVDLRATDAYLEVHVPGSLALVYEFGPGMAARARDCVPLEVPLVLLTSEEAHMRNAAGALRGKGFSVLGQVEDAINGWAERCGAPASTDVVIGTRPPEGTLLDVGDPGAPVADAGVRIPIERLWTRAGEVRGDDPVVVAAGYGVRAGLAVGMLERAGRREIVFWRGRVGGGHRPAL